ncbi:hypothetical protein [Bradyrhizobium zhanjiangense]|uniref:hypothetical protein n=1 Tax=Bradyrhizobium zhanjiangense TaxID=1325107 RepID=UPI0026D430DD
MRSIASALFALALSVPVALAQTTKLVVLTDKGRSTFDVAMALQAPWVNDLSEGLSVKDLRTIHRVVTALRKKLESHEESDALGDDPPRSRGSSNPRSF